MCRVLLSKHFQAYDCQLRRVPLSGDTGAFSPDEEETMHKLRLTLNALASIAFVLSLTAIAQGQATRTWVSAGGNDFNPCSRTAPCQTFNGAISKTAKNGEINCLDPGTYGTVTINKSLTIDCEDTQGTILAPFTNGITVNLGPAVANDPLRIVRLRGLTINGIGNGLRGILVSSGNTAPVVLHVEQVVIDGFTADGILFNAEGGEVLVRNSLIQNCSQRGLMVDSSNTAAIVHTTLESSTFAHNQQGIRGETAARISAYNCNISNNSLNGVVAFTADTSQAEINVYRCVIASNKQWGVIASADPGFGAAIIRLDGNHIVNNFGVSGAAGVQILTNGQVFSRGNNTISGNPVDVQGGSLGTVPNL
jgi:hypothetical protein